MKLLLLEDDRTTADYLVRGLGEAGHGVRWVQRGSDALRELAGHLFDAAILDRRLPGEDGLSTVKALRAHGSAIPVLMLTAMGGLDERVEGLEAGADDYLAKPFAWTELIARLDAITRRPANAPALAFLHAGDIEMNLSRRSVRRGDRAIDLQPREYRLLEQLMRNADRIVTRSMLLQNVWDFDFEPSANVVETQISRLRTKLKAGFETDPIRTIRGAGYMISSIP